MNTGHIVKSKHANQFVTLSNAFARDPKISCKAKGLLLSLISLPDDWAVTKSQLTQFCSDGYTSMDSAFKELETLGYIVGVQVFNGSRFAGWNYVIYDEPVPLDARTRKMKIKDSPITGFQDSEKLKSENPHLQKKDYTNKDYTKKENTDTHTLAPSLTEIIDAFQNLGYTDKQAEKFYNKYTAIGWVDKNKIPIVDWLSFAKASWIPRIKAIDKQNEVKDKNQQATIKSGLII